MRLGKVIAHIPARGGSKRVPSKNLRFLLGKPLLAYAIETAQLCPALDEVYVNTDSDEIEALARHWGCNVYRRPSALGTDEASGDDFTVDFMKAKEVDTLVMINPVCPLIDSLDVQIALDTYDRSDADTLITCSETQLQTFCEKRAVNFNPDGPLAPTQANPPVRICNWAVTIWSAKTFYRRFAKFGGGYCGEKRILWPIDPWKAVKISNESDFILAEKILMATQRISENQGAPRFWSRSGDEVAK